MAITVAEILSKANGRTGRAESDVNDYIKAILHDLAVRGLSLETEEAKTLTDSQANYVFTGFTAKFQHIKEVVIIDSNDIPSLPLTEITWKQYKERLEANLSATEPVEYCIYPKIGAKTLYLSPKPNATNYPSMKVSGTLRHDDSTTVSSYHEHYRELMIYGVCWKVEEYYNVGSNKAISWQGLYEAEITKIFGDLPTIGLGEYSDI